MPATRDRDPDCFEKLIRQLRTDGHEEAAHAIDTILHHTAWTTGTELLGELGLAIRSFDRQAPRVSPALRRELKACMRVVRRAWPAMWWIPRDWPRRWLPR